MLTGGMTTEFHTLILRLLLIIEPSILKMARKLNSLIAHGLMQALRIREACIGVTGMALLWILVMRRLRLSQEAFLL
jgi:hypothetical protein